MFRQLLDPSAERLFFQRERAWGEHGSGRILSSLPVPYEGGGESSGDMMVWGGHGSGRIPSSLPVPFPVGVNVKHRCSGFRDFLTGCFRGAFHPFTDSRFTDSRKMDRVSFSVCHVIRNFGSRGNVNHGGVSGRRISAAFSVLSLHGPVLSGNTHPRWFIPPAVRLPD